MAETLVVKLTVSESNSVHLDADTVYYHHVNDYEGPYEVTPTQQTQVLSTLNQRMTQDVIINPIPSNYGLISWNGAVLTVS